MAITDLHIRGYRSVRELHLPLGPVNMLVGPNGCGKTNLYRALRLMTAAAEGRLARTLADEGGMPSAMFAGVRKKDEDAGILLSVSTEAFRYDLRLGLAPKSADAFELDPDVKEETIKLFHGGRKVPVLERKRSVVIARDTEGKRITFPSAVTPSESVLSELREPHRFPELSVVRQELLGWRFYHRFRTDADSPLRRPQVGCWTPVLSHDGADLAAALATIDSTVDSAPFLHAAVAKAFPGQELRVGGARGQFGIEMLTPPIPRPLAAAELSDGTLQFLCLLAALLSPRPPSLLVLNEPETSLHPDLTAPLAGLIAAAAGRSQLWITTHSEPLAAEVSRLTGAAPIRLEKVNGETRECRSRLGE